MMSIGRNSRTARTTRWLARAAIPSTALALTAGLFAAGQFGGCISGAPLNCSNGDVDCDALPVKGGGGGMGGSVPPAATCNADTIRTAMLPSCTDATTPFPDVATFESMFLALRCGKPGICHKTGSSKPPWLDGTDIWMRLAGMKNVRADSICKTDYFVNLTDRTKSTMIIKSTAAADSVSLLQYCPSDTAVEFGVEMPFAEAMRLTDAERACITDYVGVIADNCTLP